MYCDRVAIPAYEAVVWRDWIIQIIYFHEKQISSLLAYLNGKLLFCQGNFQQKDGKFPLSIIYIASLRRCDTVL